MQVGVSEWHCGFWSIHRGLSKSRAYGIHWGVRNSFGQPCLLRVAAEHTQANVFIISGVSCSPIPTQLEPELVIQTQHHKKERGGLEGGEISRSLWCHWPIRSPGLKNAGHDCLLHRLQVHSLCKYKGPTCLSQEFTLNPFMLRGTFFLGKRFWAHCFFQSSGITADTLWPSSHPL